MPSFTLPQPLTRDELEQIRLSNQSGLQSGAAMPPADPLEQEQPAMFTLPEPITREEAERNATNAIGFQNAQANAHAQGWQDYAKTKVPVLGGIKQASDIADVASASQRIKAGTADQGDYDILANFMKQRESESERGWIARTGDLIASIPGFMVEFAATGGVGAGAKAAAKKAIGQSAETLAGRAASSLAGTAVRAALQPGIIAPELAGRLTGTADAGSLDELVNAHGESLLTALPKAYISSLIETGSESVGGKFTPAVQGAMSGIGKRLGIAWMQKTGKPASALAKMLEKGGFNGVIEEMGEERFGEILRGSTDLIPGIGLGEGYGVVGNLAGAAGNVAQGEGGKAAENLMQAGSQLASEAVGFSVPGLAGAAANRLVRGPRENNSEQQSVESQQPQSPPAPDDAIVAAAVQLLATDPAKAAVVASSDPSRKTFGDIGLLKQFRDQKQREALKDAVSQVMAGTASLPVEPQGGQANEPGAETPVDSGDVPTAGMEPVPTDTGPAGGIAGVPQVTTQPAPEPPVAQRPEVPVAEVDPSASLSAYRGIPVTVSDDPRETGANYDPVSGVIRLSQRVHDLPEGERDRYLAHEYRHHEWTQLSDDQQQAWHDIATDPSVSHFMWEEYGIRTSPFSGEEVRAFGLSPSRELGNVPDAIFVAEANEKRTSQQPTDQQPPADVDPERGQGDVPAGEDVGGGEVASKKTPNKKPNLYDIGKGILTEGIAAGEFMTRARSVGEATDDPSIREEALAIFNGVNDGKIGPDEADRRLRDIEPNLKDPSDKPATTTDVPPQPEWNKLIPKPPKVLYHGTRHSGDVTPGQGTSVHDQGVWLSEHESNAQEFAEGQPSDKGDPRVIQFSPDFKNPAYLSARDAKYETVEGLREQGFDSAYIGDAGYWVAFDTPKQLPPKRSPLSGKATETGVKPEESTQSDTPSSQDLNSGKAMKDRLTAKVDEWVAQATNSGTRPMDTRWETGAVKRLIESEFSALTKGSHGGSLAAAKIAVSKARTFSDLKAALAKINPEKNLAESDAARAAADAATTEQPATTDTKPNPFRVKRPKPVSERGQTETERTPILAHDVTEDEWTRSAIPEDEASALVQSIRSGDERSKNKGDSSPEGKTGPLVLTKLPVSVFTDEHIKYLEESTSPDRIASYAEQNVDTPIYALSPRDNPGRFGRKGWYASDGAHRLLAAIKRGDTHVNALVPTSAYKHLSQQTTPEAEETSDVRKAVEKTGMYRDEAGVKHKITPSANMVGGVGTYDIERTDGNGVREVVSTGHETLDDARDALVSLVGEPERAESETDTPEFKKWFGASKVVDDKGEPLEVYHGTYDEFDEFDDGLLGSQSEDVATGVLGHWFYAKKQGADWYSQDNPNATIKKAYLKIENPYIMGEEEFDKYENGDLDHKDGAKLRETLMAAGHDGIFVPSMDWVAAFTAGSIKSADENTADAAPAEKPPEPAADMSEEEAAMLEAMSEDDEPVAPKYEPFTIDVIESPGARRQREKAEKEAGIEPRAFQSLPQKSQDVFNTAFSGKDATVMKEAVHPSNKAYRKEFERRTGVTLPRTVSGSETAVDDYFAGRQQEKPPGKAKTKRKTRIAADQGRKELVEAVDELLGEIDLSEFQVGPNIKLARPIGKVLKKAINLGILEFTDAVAAVREIFVEKLGSDVGNRAIDSMLPTMRKVWNAYRVKRPELRLSEATSTIEEEGSSNATTKTDDETSGEPATTERLGGGKAAGGRKTKGGRGSRTGKNSKRPVVGSGGKNIGTDKPSGGTRGGTSSDAGAGVDSRRHGGTTGIDYRIPETNDIESGGQATKFDRNLAAIRVLKTLRDEGRKANAGEQEILSRQTGWGQFAKYFLDDRYLKRLGVYHPRKTEWLEGLETLDNVEPITEPRSGKSDRVVFDPNTPTGRRQIELLRLLTVEEYQASRRSTQFSHYTGPDIARAQWSWVERQIPLDARQLHVYDPSEGNGIYWGTMPDSVAARATKYGIEPDNVSLEVAGHLYQTVQHDDRYLEEVSMPDGFFDIFTSNPPFSKNPVSVGLAEDGWLKKLKPSLHNYFFLKAARKVRPGGLVSFIVTHHFMDAQSSAIREAMAEEGMKLVGAVRLPSSAFGKIAGTEVTTDIVFLQKTDSEEVGREWTLSLKSPLRKLSPTDTNSQYTKDVYLNVNEYYLENPSHIIGTQTANGTMFALSEGDEGELTVEDDGRDVAEAIREITQGFEIDREAWENGRSEVSEDEVQKAADRLPIEDHPEFSDTPVGNLVWHDDGLWVREEKYLHTSKRDFAARGLKERAPAWFGVRDAVSALTRLQVDPSAPEHVVEDLRKELKDKYEAFVKKFGPISSPYNVSKFSDDWRNSADVWALESDYNKDTKTATPADILEKRTQWPPKSRDSADTVEEALILSLQEKGVIDSEYMAKLLKGEETPEELVAELGDKVYRNPSTGTLELAEIYLSGNVRQKLAIAREAAKDRPEFERHVKALEEVLPAPSKAGEITALIGAKWIKPEQYSEFIADTLKVTGVQFTPLGEVAGGMAIDTREAEEYGNPINMKEMSAGPWTGLDIFERTLNGSALVVKIYDDRTGRYLGIDEVETAKAQDVSAKLTQEFAKWAWADPDRTEILENQFNETMRSHVTTDIPSTMLSFKGMADAWLKKMRDFQKSGAARMVMRGNTFLAYVVGAGKTLTGVAGAMEARRLGVWKKPVAVVPNHLVPQWAAEIKKYYPNARVLAATPNDFTPAKRRTLFSRIKTGDWDFVVIPQTSFKKLSVTPKYIEEFFRVQLSDLEELIAEQKENDGKGSRSPATKQLEAMKDNLTTRMESMLKQADKDQGPYFEELGIDSLIVDEAHEYKNLYFRTRHGRVPGINPTGNQKTFDMLMKTDYLNELTGGKSLTFLSGTPISNSMAELWVMQRYLQAGTLRDAGVLAFDDWKAAYGEVERLTRVDPLGRKFRQEDRFSRFVNLSSLGRMWRDIADVKTIKDIDIKRPPLIGGKPEVIEVQAHPLQKDYMLSLARRAGTMPDDPRIDNILKVMSDGGKVAIDMRLLLPNSKPLGNSKLDKAAELAYGVWKQTKAFKGTQIIWLDKGTPRKPKKLTDKMIETGSLLMGELSSGPVTIDETFELWKQAHETESNDRKKFKSWLTMIADDVVFEEGDEDSGFNIGGAADNVKNPPRYVAAISMVEPEINEKSPPPWNAYQEIKDQLIAKGVPAEEVAFIHDADTDPKKKKMFANMNSGKIRVLLASTPKLGTGANVQERLVQAIHVDAPWRPSDLEQRDGRILRPGNVSIEMSDGSPGLASQAGVDLEGVRIARIITKGTIDARYWQTLEDKARNIEQFNNADDSQNSIDGDIGGESSMEYSDLKALAADNPLFVEEADLKTLTRTLRLLKESFDSDLSRARGETVRAKQGIDRITKAIAEAEKIRDEVAGRNLPAGAETDLEIDGKKYYTTAEAAQALDAKFKSVGEWVGIKKLEDEATDWEKTNDADWTEKVEIGTLYGRKVSAMIKGGWRHSESGKYRVGNTFQQKQINREKKDNRALWVWGHAGAKVKVDGVSGVPHIMPDATGIGELSGKFKNAARDIGKLKDEMDWHEQQIERLGSTANRTFEREQEYTEATARLREVRRKLGAQGADSIVEQWTASRELLEHMGEGITRAFMLSRTSAHAGGKVGIFRDGKTTYEVLSGDPTATDPDDMSSYPPKPGDFYVRKESKEGEKEHPGDWETMKDGKIRGKQVVATEPAYGVVERPGEPSRSPFLRHRNRKVSRLAHSAEQPDLGFDPGEKTQITSLTNRGAKPISAADIVKTWERDFGVPLRTGKTTKPGIYKWLIEVARLRDDYATNLAVAAHEVAHHIDKTANVVDGMPSVIASQVEELDYEDGRKDRKTAKREGFAEFIRMWVTDEDTETAAPDVHNWFENVWMAGNPELAKQLVKAREHAKRWSNQGAFQRAKQMVPGRSARPVDFSTKDVADMIRTARMRFMRNYITDDAAMTLVGTEYVKRGGNLTDLETPGELALALKFTGPAHAERSIMEGVHTVSQEHTILAPALKEAFQHVNGQEEYDEAHAYAVALFTQELHDKKPKYNTSMHIDDADYIVSLFNADPSKRDRYQKFAKAITDYNDGLIEMLHDAGVITAEEKGKILNAYDSYIPLHREVGKGNGAMGGAGLANLPKALRRRSMRGSGAPLVDIVEASMRRSLTFYNRALKAQVTNSLIRIVDPQVNGKIPMGTLAERLPPDMVPSTITLQETLDTLVNEGLIDEEEAEDIKVVGMLREGANPSKERMAKVGERHGIDETASIEEFLQATEDVPDAMATILTWRPSYNPRADKHIVQFIYKGKPVLYQLDPLLYDTVTNMDAMEMGALTEIARSMNHAFKTGAVGISTAFGGQNILRDWQDAQFHSKNQGVESTYAPFAWLGRYLWAEYAKGKSSEANAFVKLFKEWGGELTTRLGYDAKSQRLARRDLLGVFDVRNPLSKGVTAMSRLVQATDVGPRLAEFAAVMNNSGYYLKDGKIVDGSGNPANPPRRVIVKAINAAGDATVNFKRSGVRTKYFDAWVPFTNAAIQSRYRQVKAVASLGKGIGDKEAQRVLFASMATAASAAVFWALFRDDDDDERAKWLKGNYWVFSHNGQPIVRVAKSRDYRFISNMTEAMLDDYAGKKHGKSLQQAKDEVLEAASMSGGGVLREGVEQLQNWDYFRDSPIEPDYMLRYEPWRRGMDDQNITELSKLIGQYTGLAGVSAVRVEHLLTATTGGAYRRMMMSGQRLLKGEAGSRDIPFVRGFAMDRDYYQSVDEFYGEQQKVERKLSTAKLDGEPDYGLLRRNEKIGTYAALMTSIRAAERSAFGSRTRDYEKYIVGLSRDMLGKDPLDSFPNPITDRNLPIPVRDVLNKYFGTARDHAKFKGRPRTGENLKARQASYNAQRDVDLELLKRWLSNRG